MYRLALTGGGRGEIILRQSGNCSRGGEEMSGGICPMGGMSYAAGDAIQ